MSRPTLPPPGKKNAAFFGSPWRSYKHKVQLFRQLRRGCRDLTAAELSIVLALIDRARLPKEHEVDAIRDDDKRSAISSTNNLELTGLCYPSLERIATDTRLHKRTVMRTLKQLVTKLGGERYPVQLTTTDGKSKGRGKGREATRYWLTFTRVFFAQLRKEPPSSEPRDVTDPKLHVGMNARLGCHRDNGAPEEDPISGSQDHKREEEERPPVAPRQQIELRSPAEEDRDESNQDGPQKPRMTESWQPDDAASNFLEQLTKEMGFEDEKRIVSSLVEAFRSNRVGESEPDRADFLRYVRAQLQRAKRGAA